MRASSGQSLTFFAPSASSARSAVAMPLRKTSLPMRPTSVCWAACQARCSPPPKPISSQTCGGRCGKSVIGSSGPASGSAKA
jgi:hypothetical protein